MKRDYSHKIPSLPYLKGKKQKNRHPGHGENHDCKGSSAKRPEPFDGVEKRKKEPERQNYPFLSIHIDFLDQQGVMRHGGDMIVSVTNNGNATAHTPFVELIESDFRGLSVNPPDPDMFHRRGYSMLSALYPHQTRTVQIPWSRHFVSGRIVGICYDPLLDPRPEVPYLPWNLPDYHKKITSIHWSHWPFEPPFPDRFIKADKNRFAKR